MKQIPAYVCEKCLYYELGEENALKVRAHERMPTTGICNSLDGLIVKTGFEQNYMVFRRAPLLSPQHEALYHWKTYRRQNLEPKDSPFLIKMEESFHRICNYKGLTAEYIVGAVLHDGKSENTYKIYNELSEREFQRVAKKLKQMYPKLYASIEFKREPKFRGRSHHSKK